MLKKIGLIAAFSIAFSTSVSAGVIYSEGFEGQDNTWVDYTSPVENVASGTYGINANQGNGYGYLNADESTAHSGAFTRFGGYSNQFGGGFTTSLDVYLDPDAWALGEGFDYSSAVSRQNGNHLRDFIFHVGQTESSLVVGASNNSDFTFNQSKVLGNDYFEVVEAGWYTFEHVFYDNLGALAGDFNLFNGGALLFNNTRSNASDDIATLVGGNRYGWITFTDNNMALDNSILSYVEVPEPHSLIMFAFGLFGVVTTRRKMSRAK